MRDLKPVECTNSTTRAARGHENSYAQHRIAAGLNSWVFDYWNDEPLEKRAVGCGLEVGVQIDGEWFCDGHITGTRLFEPGAILGVTTGERYVHVHRRRATRGRQVGFVVHGEMLGAIEGDSRELRFKRVGTRDSRFSDFCRTFATRIRGGEPPSEDVAGEVRAFIERQFDLTPPSRLIKAKKELEANFEFDLPMSMITETAGIHPETFCRQFLREYGISPTRYRVLYRLNQSTRLLWSRPDMTIDEIAMACGFRSKSYFHRAYLRQYGTTPNAARARFVAATRGSSHVVAENQPRI